MAICPVASILILRTFCTQEACSLQDTGDFNIFGLPLGLQEYFKNGCCILMIIAWEMLEILCCSTASRYAVRDLVTDRKTVVEVSCSRVSRSKNVTYSR